MNPDVFNGVLQVCGAGFVVISIVKLNGDRLVRGVSWLHVGFFTVWGYWNLFYFPHLGQWVSFAGALVIVLANTIWMGQLIYWSWRERAGFA